MKIKQNLPPGGEQRYRLIDGELTLGADGVKAIAEFMDKVGANIRLGILDAADYAGFKGDEELAQKLYELRWQLANEEQPVFHVPDTFSSSYWNNFGAEPIVGDEPLDDSINIEYFNTYTGKILCYGFGPELEDTDGRQYCLAFLADSRDPEQQAIRILFSDISEDDQQVDDLLARLLPELSVPTSEPPPAT